MTALVEGGEKAGVQEVGVDARGDANIAQAEAGGEWVGRLVQSASVQIIAKLLGDTEAYFELLCFWERLVKAAIIYSFLLCGYLPDHRHYSLTQLGEYGV